MTKRTALTFTALVGYDCPNNCRGCISTMTADYGFGKRILPDWDRFYQAVRKAQYHEADTVLFSSKRAVESDPELLTKYLLRLFQHRSENRGFSKIEMQSEGSLLAQGGLYDDFLGIWREMDLSRIAISVYHHDPLKNAEIFRPKSGKYFDLPKLAQKLIDKKYLVRISCCMYKGYIDSPEKVNELIQFTKDIGADQLTLRKAEVPKNARNQKVADWVKKNRLNEEDEGFKKIKEFLEKEFYLWDVLPHGAPVYSTETGEGKAQLQIAWTTGLPPEDQEDTPKESALELEAKEGIRELIWIPPNILSPSWTNVVNLL